MDVSVSQIADDNIKAGKSIVISEINLNRP